MVQEDDKREEILETVYTSVDDVKTRLNDVVQYIASKQKKLDEEAEQNLLAIKNLKEKIKELESIFEEKQEELLRLEESRERYTHLKENLSALEEHRDAITNIADTLDISKQEKTTPIPQSSEQKKGNETSKKEVANTDVKKQNEKTEDSDGIMVFRKKLFRG
jgi:hypothetical protein